MFGRRRRRRVPPRPAARSHHPARPVDAGAVGGHAIVEEMFVGGNPSPFTEDDAARIKRNNDAASLVEEDTMGYLVIRLKKDGGQPSGRLMVSGHVRPEWRGHFRATLDRVARGLTG